MGWTPAGGGGAAPSEPWFATGQVNFWQGTDWAGPAEGETWYIVLLANANSSGVENLDVDTDGDGTADFTIRIGAGGSCAFRYRLDHPGKIKGSSLNFYVHYLTSV